MKITFTIPTYNEAENLPKLVSAFFGLSNPELNLLIVDDNSPDGTGKLADDLCEQWKGRMDVIHRPGKMGLGTAYITGFKYAVQQGAQALGQMDADFSHPVEKIPEMVAAISAYDLVLGSRYVRGGSLDENWPLWRKGLSAFGNFYARTILGLPMRDCTGGFRLYRREVINRLPLDRIRSNGYIFQVEMAYLVNKLGFSVHEIPIYFADRRWGKSKMNFHIQAEAAVRVWQLPVAYRDIHPR